MVRSRTSRRYLADDRTGDPAAEAAAVRAEALVADFFNRYGAHRMVGLRSILQHPLQSVRARLAIGRLPVLTASIGTTPEARVVLRGLARTNRAARLLVRGTTAVLTVPGDPSTYLAGSSESKRALRTKVNRGDRRGFVLEALTSDEARTAVLRTSDEYERRHPDANYRNGAPRNEHLLQLPTWYVARDGSGHPLLLAVVAVEGEWAVLEYFKTLEDSPDASLARHWTSAKLVGELSARHVRWLADVLSPIGLPSGLRSFQRRLGYRLVRVRIVRASEVGSGATSISRA